MEFLEQLRDLSKQVKFKANFGKLSEFSNIVVSGMGGSGIAGNIFSELYTKAPVQVISDYNLPEYAGRNTLFIGISYSGNTEETLSATREAIKMGCQIRLVTSGGELSELGQDTVKVPGGLQPRAALGYLIKPFLSTFVDDNEGEYERISGLLERMDTNNGEQSILAEELAKNTLIPVILGYPPFRWIAYRWKTQFNENSKVLAFSSFFPELNHNETVPFRDTYKKDVFRFIAFGGADQRIEKRIGITSEITKTDFLRIEPKGETVLQRMFYLIHYGDYVTYHLAKYRNLDPEDVSVITELKNRLRE